MGSMLMRLAPLTTTGVGSLPFARPGEAARHAVHGYELPFCPQLPRAYGDMLQEWLGADPGRCGWAPDRDRQLPAAWDAFILELLRHPPEHGVVKLQVTGPLTLAMALERDATGGRTDLEGLGREISTWLAAAVHERVSALSAAGLFGLVMVDEPGLMAAQRAGATPAIWDAIRAVVPAWGLHVCGEVPWRLVDAAEPDVISYDLVRSGCGPVAQTVIRRLMRRRGRIIWGAADPLAVNRPSLMIGRVSTAVRAVAGRRWRTDDVLGASLLSASCGTGGVSVSAEYGVARALQVVAGRLRGDPDPELGIEPWTSGKRRWSLLAGDDKRQMTRGRATTCRDRDGGDGDAPTGQPATPRQATGEGHAVMTGSALECQGAESHAAHAARRVVSGRTGSDTPPADTPAGHVPGERQCHAGGLVEGEGERRADAPGM